MVDTWTFEAGEAVPEWLLSISPTSPGAVLNSFRFTVPVAVIEVDDHLLVVARERGGLSEWPFAVDVKGGTVQVNSVDKPVCIAHAITIITLPGQGKGKSLYLDSTPE